MGVVPVLPPVASGFYSSSSVSAVVAASAFLQKPPQCELVQIVAQSLAATTLTPITFTSHTVDRDYLGGAMHSDSVNTSRATAIFAGWYQVSGAVGYAASATGRRLASWAVNGTEDISARIFVPTTAVADVGVPARTKVIYLNVGDYIELWGYQESGGVLNTTTPLSSMSLRWVGN